MTTFTLVTDTNGDHMPEPQPYRPMCRHGVTPALHVQQIHVGLRATFDDTVPGRTDLVYDCPTPMECADKAYRYLIDAGIEPPEAACPS